jgi:hypothetical protein
MVSEFSWQTSMTDIPSIQLNRGAVYIRFKQPYVDWARQAGPAPLTDFTLDEANDDGELFLIPTYESAKEPVDGTEDAIKWVERRWKMFFEHFLNDWIMDESAWPKKRTLKMFREWFEVEYRSTVWDMGSDPLMLERWVEDDEDDRVSPLH